MLIAVDAVRRRHLRELAAPDRRPVLPLLVPPGEDARRHERIAACGGTVLTVVGDKHAPQPACEPLRVVTGDARARCGRPAVRPRQARLLQVGGDSLVVHAVFADERVDGERAHVKLVESRLHRRHIDLVRGIRQMPCRAREAPGHLRGRHHAHVPLRVNHVGTDQQLVRLAVDHAVRGRSAHGTGVRLARQVRTDAVEFVRRPRRRVRGVRHHPQVARPRHDRARATFALVVEHREVRVDSPIRGKTLRRERRNGSTYRHRHDYKCSCSHNFSLSCRKSHRASHRTRARMRA